MCNDDFLRQVLVVAELAAAAVRNLAVVSNVVVHPGVNDCKTYPQSVMEARRDLQAFVNWQWIYATRGFEAAMASLRPPSQDD